MLANVLSVRAQEVKELLGALESKSPFIDLSSQYKVFHGINEELVMLMELFLLGGLRTCSFILLRYLG